MIGPSNSSKEYVKGNVDINASPKKSPDTISSASPKFLAWCSGAQSHIKVVNIETKEEHANFNGAPASHLATQGSSSCSLLKEIPSTTLLVSLTHSVHASAKMEIFDIPQKEKVRKLYTFEEVLGITGFGDITYNPRRNILGAIPVKGKIDNHLFSLDCDSGEVKLVRKSKWNPRHSSTWNNWIPTFDFNPSGESLALIDAYGLCLVSDINTNELKMSATLSKLNDGCARGRWSTNIGEPLLFAKFNYNELNILDVERAVPTLKESYRLDNKSVAYWIDICPNNGALLAASGVDSNIKIYDRRESKIVKIIDEIHTNAVHCVRWSPNGEFLASASNDGTAKLLDFRTGKSLYTGTTVKDHVESVCFI